MSETYVIHWAEPRQTGEQHIVGNTMACVRAIMAQDVDPRAITKIDHYDADEGWAEHVPLDEMAIRLACYAIEEQGRGSGGVTDAIFDFIHDHGGSGLTHGLRRLDPTFAAA